MNVQNLALQAASMKGWPAQQEVNGEVRIEVITTGQRTQLVTITNATDADGDAAVFIWSKAADLSAISDPWRLLQLNTQLTYGRVAVRGQDCLVMHSLLDQTADMAEVGKSIFFVAKAADDIEQQTYGQYTDQL